MGNIKTEFIDRIHIETGVPKNQLAEAYDLGIKAASEIKVSENPVPWAKSRVYRLVSTLKT